MTRLLQICKNTFLEWFPELNTEQAQNEEKKSQKEMKIKF